MPFIILWYLKQKDVYKSTQPLLLIFKQKGILFMTYIMSILHTYILIILLIDDHDISDHDFYAKHDFGRISTPLIIRPFFQRPSC